MPILDGKKIAKEIKKQIGKNVAKENIKPGLAIILIGKNPASLVYVKLKEKAAQQLGFYFEKICLSSSINQEKIIEIIKKLNKDKKIHGIIVQIPVPKKINTNLLIEAIAPEKDIDGFNQKSLFVSPVYQAIIKLLKACKKNLKNKKVLILSKNLVFAQPLTKILKTGKIKSELLLIKSKLSSKTKKADILIVALGKPKIIKPSMVKKNAIVIDVGYNLIKNKSVGDVDHSVSQKTPYLSPVPGGVGPLTVAYLLKNVYLSAKKNQKYV